MKKIIIIIAVFLLSSCGREVDHYGDVVDKTHQLPSYNTSGGYYIVKEVFYKDGTKGYKTKVVEKDLNE